MGLVKRVPVYQASMGSDPCNGKQSHPGRGSLKKTVPSYQADSGKDMIGKVKVGGKTAKSKSRAGKDVQKIKQKAGLTNQGYGI